MPTTLIGPDPDALHPMLGQMRVTFIRNLDLPDDPSRMAWEMIPPNPG